MKRKLNATAVKNAKPGRNPRPGSPQGTDYKMTDGGGLYLFVTTKGARVWRYDYTSPLTGRAKTMTFGSLDDVSLEQARTKHDAAHRLVAEGKDPVEQGNDTKRAAVAKAMGDRPFRDVAAEWKAVKYPASRRAKTTINAKQNSIDKLNAAFGDWGISTVNEVSLLADVLKKCELAETYETRVKVQRDAIAIMGYAVGLGLIKTNPFAGVKFAAAFTAPSETYESFPAITEAEAFGQLMRDIDARLVVTHDKRTRFNPINRISLRILSLVCCRPGELAQAEWTWVKWTERKLVIPPTVQKMRTLRKLRKSPRAGKAFEIPLSRQAIAELRELQKLTGDSKFLFPARPSRWGDAHQVVNQPIAETTLNAALIRAGYKDIHCAHGFRSTFSTNINAERVTLRTTDGEEVEAPRWVEQKALVEVQLDHDDASTQAIYDRGGYWKQRCEIMQFWADRVDAMRGQKVGGVRKQGLRLVA